MTSLSPFQQYQKQFPDSLPEGTARVVTVMGMWDEAEAKLAQAMQDGKPISDWGAFVSQLHEHRKAMPDVEQAPQRSKQ